eukprot:s4338_g7.t1
MRWLIALALLSPTFAGGNELPQTWGFWKAVISFELFAGGRKAALLSLGVPAQSVVPTTKVLGVDFSRISGTGPVAAGRDAAAACMVARLATMPFPPAFREDLFRTRIVPLLAWRAWWEPVDKQTLGEKWATKLRKAFGVARAASRHLWKLLTGVHVEMGPATDIAGLRHFARAYAYWTGSGVELRRGRWRARAAMLMRRAGFREQRPGLWRDSQGVLCRWEHPHVKHDLDRVAHKLRELSRKEQFQAFLLHPRREQAEAISAGVGYDEGICKVARALFSRASKEQRGVMLGASYSVAAFDKLRRNAGKHDQVLVRKCPYCDAPVVPDWQHLSWECPSFARDRPEVPAYVLSRRFGWPGLDSEPIRLELSAYVGAAVHLLGTFIRWFEFLNCLFAVAPVSYTNDSMTNLYQDSDEGGCSLEMPRVQARYAGKGHRALDETHEEVPPEAAQLYHQAGLQVVYAAQAHEERQWK